MSITATTQNATQRQIMLCFAYLAYCGETITTADPNFANVEQTIYGLLTGAISPTASSPLVPITAAPCGPWNVVWGPAIYTVPGALYQDNLMYVVQNQADPTQYAIAIRGTNFSSDLDWLLEDFDVLQMMPWPNGDGAMISESTNIDMQILLAMQGVISTGGVYGNSSASLLDFLSSQTTKNAICVGVTGHSLGGCLASTFALYLNDNQSQWDAAYTTSPSTLYAVTFAGPTAGNQAFANYSNQQFQNQYKKNPAPNWDTNWGGVIPTNCDAVQNSMDIVPLMWVADNISSGTENSKSPVFNIYSPSNGCPNPPYASTLATDAQGLNFAYPGVQWQGSNDVNTNLADVEDGAGDFAGWNSFVVPTVLPALAAMFNSSTTQYTQLDCYDILQGQFINPPATGWPAALTFPVVGSTGGYNTLKVFMQAFLAEAGTQHSDSYAIALDIPNLNAVVDAINNP